MSKKSKEFSKSLLIQESMLIWIITISAIALAFYCIMNQYFCELPWITAMIGFPWAAYGVSQACYYKKAEKENTKNGIKFESALLEQQSLIGESAEVNDWHNKAAEFFADQSKAVG